MLRLALAVALLAGDVESPADPPAVPTTDVLYLALHGDADAVPAAELTAYPGRFVGRAIRTRGRLERGRSGPSAFELAGDQARLSLQLEPQAAASTAENASFWLGKPVEVEGFFYRTSQAGSYALRAWLLRPAEAPTTAAAASAVPRATLEDLVYGEGRFDGKLVRVSGTDRGPNTERDLPVSTRRGPHDWVLKDGYFAVWITGRQPPAGERGAGGTPSAQAASVALEVIGVPSTAQGVVRLAAREVATRWDGGRPVVARALVTGDSGWAAVPPRVSFVYPVEGQRLGTRGRMIVQFNKAMDPSRFASQLRARYQQGEAALPPPRLTLDYSDPYRALVITPEPPPPADCLVLLELLGGIIDVNGRALAPPEEPLRFRSSR